MKRTVTSNNANTANTEKDTTLVIRQSTWSPSPEIVLEDARRDSMIVNLNLPGISLTSSILQALTATLRSPRKRNDTTTTPCYSWNQVHIHQCQVMGLDCSELCKALMMHVSSLIISGSSDLLTSMLSAMTDNNNNTTKKGDNQNKITLQNFTINQPRNGLNESQCLQLGQFLTSTSFCSSSLQQLSLKGTKIYSPGLLAPGLSNATNLERLLLSDTGLSDQGRADIIVCLDDNDSNQYGIGAVHRLLQSKVGKLKALDLSNLHLQNGHVTKLFQALAVNVDNSQLEQLNLSFNDINCDGIVSMSKFLPALKRLTKLSLKPNPWGTRGASALLEAMKSNVSIEYLDSLLSVKQATLLRYYSTLNRGGRRCIFKKIDNSNGNNGIPLGLWPILLERAWKISYHEHPAFGSSNPKPKLDAIYYLLRNGDFLNKHK